MDIVKGSGAVDASLLDDPSAFRSRIVELLGSSSRSRELFPTEAWNGMISSSVMLLLGYQPSWRCSTGSNGDGYRNSAACPDDICIILNKRSRWVRQAGDLCCPGGSVERVLDPRLARLLSLPCSPLSLWPPWASFRRERPQDAKLLSLLLATSLRESWEEMRLNPFCIRFLGPLPFHLLPIYHAVIHPMVGWVFWQKRFSINWEVEKIVAIPIRLLLDPSRYARFRLHVPHELEEKMRRTTQDFPCFICEDGSDTEVLWGATYKIVTFFIELLFGFTAPEYSTLPIVPGLLDEGYVYGRQ